MKKLLIVTLLLSICVIGCSNDNEEKEINNENLEKVDSQVNQNNNDEDLESDYFKEISADKFEEMMNSDKKYFFFIGRDTCPACKTFKPIAMKYAKDKKFYIYYVNSTFFEESDWNIIEKFVRIDYIPTILIVKNGNILYNEHGVKSYDIVDSIVKEYMN